MPDTLGALNAVATGYQPHSHLRCAATTSAGAGVAICYHTGPSAACQPSRRGFFRHLKFRV